MSASPAAASDLTPLDEATLGNFVINAVTTRSGSVRLVGSGLHDLAVRLLGDGVQVEMVVPGRRDARAFRRALRDSDCAPAVTPVVADLRVDLPQTGTPCVLVCRLDPRTFPFPRHTVRQLGRAVTPGGLVVLLPSGEVPWPTGLVDAWAASAGLAPEEHRGVGGPLPFAGAVYESRG